MVKQVSSRAGAMGVVIDLGSLAEECKIGDSVAINGVCLTITRLERGLATFDVSGETLKTTTLSGLRAASKVNIETALKATGRFGGHIVQGHVDGTATVKQIDRQGAFWSVKFLASAGLADQMVLKGSIAVDGISLTISELDGQGFGITLIPETMQKTTLREAKVGDVVNIETDIIVKAIKKQLEKILPQGKGLTMEKLQGLGF